MAHAEHSVTIRRPAAEVYDFVADGANNARWRSGVVRLERTSGSGGVGTTYRQVLKGPGARSIDGDYRVTVADRPSTLAFEVTAGPARPTGRYDFAPAGDGATTLTFTLDLQPKGLMRLMAPMINRQVRAEVAALDELKRVMER